MPTATHAADTLDTLNTLVAWDAQALQVLHAGRSEVEALLRARAGLQALVDGGALAALAQLPAGTVLPPLRHCLVLLARSGDPEQGQAGQPPQLELHLVTGALQDAGGPAAAVSSPSRIAAGVAAD